jgi:hypothetical protein
MVDPIRSSALPDAPTLDPSVTPPSRPPRKLVEAGVIERRVDDTLDVLDRVQRDADARRCSAKDGPLEVGRMHAAAPPTPMQTELDAFMRSAYGSYRAEGRTVQVMAFFRMEGGMHAIQPADAREREVVLSRARLDEAGGMVSTGRGSLDQIRQVTQALLDAGKLEEGPPETLCDRVRGMMWKYGVGIDCAGYAARAFLASRHAEPSAYGLRRADYEDLQSLASNPRFARVDFTGAKPGDLFILGPGGDPPRGVGHCVAVYSHDVADARTKDLLLGRCGTQASKFIRASDKLHVYQVDSSWGAGSNGASYGGVRRETWLYDERSKTWARYSPGQASLGGSGFETDSSPCGHPIRGVFRPRNEM